MGGNSSRCRPWNVQSRRNGGRNPGAETVRRRAFPAPYVGHGSAAPAGGGFRAVVAGMEGGGADVVVGRGRVLPHETRAPVATIAPSAARRLPIAALSAEMAPEIGEE